MMLISHYVASSAIEGAGLFTAQDIAEGEAIYQFDYRFVMVVSEAEIREMSPVMQAVMLKYSYRGRGRDRLNGAVYYCADDSRFFNHSDTPNTRWLEESDRYVATCFIPANTELTCNYNEFSEPGDASLNLG